MLTADSNEIIAAGDYGIQATESSEGELTLTATNGNNIVKAENGTAIRANGEKVITLDATGNNIVIGGVYGIENTETDGIVKKPDKIYTDLDAVNNNIYGADTAIRSNGLGIIDINATQNNAIGFLIDKEGNITDRAKEGFDVEEGTVNITANENNFVYVLNKGIYVHGENASLSMSGVNNIIDVSGGPSGNNDYIYGINASASADVDIKGSGKAEINITDVHGGVRGIYAGKGGNVSIEHGSLELNVVHPDADGIGSDQKNDGSVYGIAVNANTMEQTEKGDNSKSEVNIKTTGNIDLTVSSLSEADWAAVVYTDYGGKLKIESTDGSLNFNVTADNSGNTFTTSGIYSDKNSTVEINAKEGITINSTDKTQNATRGNVYGINNSLGTTNESTRTDAGIVTLKTQGDVNITANATDKTTATAVQAVSKTGVEDKGHVNISGNNITLNASGKTAYVLSGSTAGKNNIVAAGNVKLNAYAIEQSTGGYARGIHSFNGKNIVTTNSDIEINANGLGVNDTVQGIYSFGNNSNDGVTELTGANVSIYASNDDGNTYGISAEGSGNSKVKLTAKSGDNTIISDGIGVETKGSEKTSVLLKAETNNNSIYAGKLLKVTYGENDSAVFGDTKAISALAGSTVTLNAGNINNISGAVYAKDANTNVDMTGLENGYADNYVYSTAAIANAGGLTNTTVISALYAEAGAQINVSGANNTIMTYYSKPTDDKTSERVIWAYDAADITIDGATTISTAMYDESPNNMDIAIAAGTATGLDKDDFTDEVLADLDIATVTLNYENSGESKSSITGDILSAY